MSKVLLVKDLTGRTLDRFVAIANVNTRPYSKKYYCVPYYSSSWVDGGPVIEDNYIQLCPVGKGQWAAHIEYQKVVCGSTPLEAAMRAYVLSKLGPEVSDD